MSEKLLIFPNKQNRHRSEQCRDYTYRNTAYSNKSERYIEKYHMLFQFYDRTSELPMLSDSQGVYILYNINPASSVLEVYIGKSSDVKRRQTEHARSRQKDRLTRGVVITVANNGFNSGDIDNLENALYLNFKCRERTVLYNSNVPAADDNYHIENPLALERTDIIANVVLDKIFGESACMYGLNKVNTTDILNLYTFIRPNKSNVSLECVPKRKTMLIHKGALLAVEANLDGDSKLQLSRYLKKNIKLIELQEDISSDSEKIYLFKEDKKITTEDFKILFGKVQRDHWINSQGEINKLCINGTNN